MSIEPRDYESKLLQGLSTGTVPFILHSDRSDEEKKESARILRYQADQEKEKLLMTKLSRLALGALVSFLATAALLFLVLKIAKVCFT